MIPHGYCMTAKQLLRDRKEFARGTVERVVWRLPQPVPPCTHCFKYRLVYVEDGRRVIGFDNERGKGDHYHSEGREAPYRFTTLERLLDDFSSAVAQWVEADR
jgi:hypothetical protein